MILILDVISSIITSFQGLGLKLESTKGSVETIVIDHAWKSRRRTEYADFLQCILAFAATMSLFSQDGGDPASLRSGVSQAIEPSGPDFRPGCSHTSGRPDRRQFSIAGVSDRTGVRRSIVPGDGRTGWIKNDRFDIEAKLPVSSLLARQTRLNFKLPPNDEQRQMLQTLLADRFQLKFHRENKERPVYVADEG